MAGPGHGQGCDNNGWVPLWVCEYWKWCVGRDWSWPALKHTLFYTNPVVICILCQTKSADEVNTHTDPSPTWSFKGYHCSCGGVKTFALVFFFFFRSSKTQPYLWLLGKGSSDLSSPLLSQCTRGADKEVSTMQTDCMTTNDFDKKEMKTILI